MMSWRTEWKRIVMVLFVLAGAVAANAQTRPEFSGTWQQDNAHSVPARTGDTTLKIVQHDPEFSVETTIVRAGHVDRHALQRYTTDGQPSTSMGADGDSFETRIVWDGPVLVFTIVEHEDGRTIHSSERWSMSEDGQTLKRVRRSSKSEGESVIVYQRVHG